MNPDTERALSVSSSRRRDCNNKASRLLPMIALEFLDLRAVV